MQVTATLVVVELTWFAPVIVLLVGAVGTIVLARRVADASDELAVSLRRFAGLERALVPVRVQTRRARAAVDRRRPQ